MNNKVILTGCSCCLKSSVGRYVSQLTNYNFIQSDSKVLSELREFKLSDWRFANRMALKYYMIQVLPQGPYIIERSILDQLIFCDIASEGWFEYDGERQLDVQKVQKDKSKFITMEQNCQIQQYILLEMKAYNFIQSIIDDPNFMQSKRSDSFCSLDDYIELQTRFISRYKGYLELYVPDAQLNVITVESDSTNPRDIIKTAATEVLSVLVKY